VYGVTKETYERITRRPGSFDAFMNGLDLLLKNNIKVRFKAMALRSNLHEMTEIARFCRERTTDYFRFDPVLHLRYDLDPVKNEEIRSELLSPEEVVELEQSDPERCRNYYRRIGTHRAGYRRGPHHTRRVAGLAPGRPGRCPQDGNCPAAARRHRRPCGSRQAGRQDGGESGPHCR